MLHKFNPSKTKYLCQLNKILGFFFHTPTAKTPLQLAKIKQLLVVDFTGLGDIVMLTPFLRILKKNCPLAQITVVCSAGGREILSTQQLVDKFVILEGKYLANPLKMFWNGLKIYRALKQINQETYDISLEPRGDLRHIFFMHFCKAIRKASYNYTGGECFLTDVVIPSEKTIHLVEDKINFLKQLGFAIPAKDIYPQLVLTDRQQQYRQSFLRKHQLENTAIIGLHPGASQLLRKWPHYPELLKLLHQHITQVTFFIFEGPGDMLQAEEILNAADQCQAHTFRIKTSLKNMMSLMTCCDFVICNDSSSGHFAAALGIPTFVIFGASDPTMVKPYHPSCVYPINATLNCASPCIKKPCSYPPECLSKITPQTVYEMIQKQVNISVSVT